MVIPDLHACKLFCFSFLIGDNVIVNVEPRPEDHSFEVQISYDIIGDSFPKQEFEFLLETTR